MGARFSRGGLLFANAALERLKALVEIAAVVFRGEIGMPGVANEIAMLRQGGNVLRPVRALSQVKGRIIWE
jgi:hypothetical protein